MHGHEEEHQHPAVLRAGVSLRELIWTFGAFESISNLLDMSLGHEMGRSDAKKMPRREKEIKPG